MSFAYTDGAIFRIRQRGVGTVKRGTWLGRSRSSTLPKLQSPSAVFPHQLVVAYDRWHSDYGTTSTGTASEGTLIGGGVGLNAATNLGYAVRASSHRLRHRLQGWCILVRPAIRRHGRPFLGSEWSNRHHRYSRSSLSATSCVAYTTRQFYYGQRSYGHGPGNPELGRSRSSTPGHSTVCLSRLSPPTS